jgi:hypothetical protein
MHPSHGHGAFRFPSVLRPPNLKRVTEYSKYRKEDGIVVPVTRHTAFKVPTLVVSRETLSFFFSSVDIQYRYLTARGAASCIVRMIDPHCTVPW